MRYGAWAGGRGLGPATVGHHTCAYQFTAAPSAVARTSRARRRRSETSHCQSLLTKTRPSTTQIAQNDGHPVPSTRGRCVVRAAARDAHTARAARPPARSQPPPAHSARAAPITFRWLHKRGTRTAGEEGFIEERKWVLVGDPGEGGTWAACLTRNFESHTLAPLVPHA